ncbi:MAG: S-layer protein [Herbinix sp.]|jgi:hypothetical protein|nr:S-layer protein [Herbinix sp.]
MKPEIIIEKYPTEDIVVAAINGAEYEMDLTGEADMAPVLQKAIDDCKEIGGGVVYLPEGRYALKSYLTIKTGVTLRGEWINPEQEYNAGRGTILCCYCGKNDEQGTPQITMEACTGLVNMTIYYPQQEIEAPVPYSPAVRQHGADSMTLMNVTLVNPWIGVQSGPDGNELHFLNNVYITPMHIGFYMDMTTDIGRMQNLNISSKYLEQFTLLPSDQLMSEKQIGKLREHMLAEVTGVFMARSDWEYGYDIKVEGCKIGFMITSMKDGGPNTQISGLNMHNCDIGFKLVNVNPYGVALSNSSITADREGLTAAIVSDVKFSTVMQLNGVDLSGPYQNLVIHEGKGQLSFINCTFKDWNVNSSAVLQKCGGLSVLQCEFLGEGLHYDIKEGVSGTQLLGCDYHGNVRMTVDQEATAELVISEEPLDLPVAPRKGHKPYPFRLHASTSLLYNILDYGAVADGKTDNTAAFQTALNEAQITGGVVYVPAGWYRFNNSITIPSGVELRGSYAVPCHTLGGGSVLQPFGGKGDEEGTPFVIMEADSVVNGLLVHYPEQDPTYPVAYPWSIQAQGNYCRIINTVFVNSWLGLDLGTYGSENHYVSYISGAPIRCGVFIGNNSKEGWIENVQYNPHYWYRSSLPNKPKNETWKSFWHNQIKYLDAFKFGYNEQVHLLGTFVFAAKHGLYLTMQEGKGTSGTFIGHGTDGGENGLYIDGAGEVDFINTELVTIESPNTRIYLQVAKNAPGQIRFYNTLMWGAPHYAVVIDGGDVDLQQYNVVDQGKTAITVNGGDLRAIGGFFYNNANHVVMNGGKALAAGNMTVKKSKERDTMESCLDVNKNGGILEERFNWAK